MTTYCFDTSALLDNPNALLDCGNDGDELLIPFCVLDELDGKKDESGKTGKHARDVLRMLDEQRNNGSLADGVKLSTGATLFVVQNADGKDNDQRILNLATTQADILVSNDIAMRVKADSLGIVVDGFEHPDQFSIYTGSREVDMSHEDIDSFYEQGKLEIPQYVLDEHDVCVNEMLIVKGPNGQQSALARVILDSQTSKFNMVPIKKHSPWGVHARNKEQELALNLLTNQGIHLVSMVGRAGCGKSFLALAAGVEQVVEKHVYDQLLIIRPIVSVGADLGYLPGTMEEKLDPWLQPIKDNLNVLFANRSNNVQMYFENGTFQMEALSYIRGRSIPKAYIIVDECQNLSLNELKTVLTRAADGSKIVLTGDIEQIDKHKLDVVNNGLSVVVEKLKNYTITGHVTLTKGQRSPLASVCAEVL